MQGLTLPYKLRVPGMQGMLLLQGAPSPGWLSPLEAAAHNEMLLTDLHKG